MKAPMKLIEERKKHLAALRPVPFCVKISPSFDRELTVCWNAGRSLLEDSEHRATTMHGTRIFGMDIEVDPGATEDIRT